jgi:hypothetical protein
MKREIQNVSMPCFQRVFLTFGAIINFFFHKSKSMQTGDKTKLLLRRRKERDAMKKIVILGFLFLLLASQTWGQEKCEAPVWNVGDKWTYKDASMTTYTNEVVDVKENVFILKYRAIQNPAAFDKKTMNIKFLVGPGGNRILDTDFLGSGRKLFDFPIFVGKQWKDSFEVSVRTAANAPVIVNHTVAFKIENIAEVNTPAGTFKTYVIYFNQRSMRSGNNGWMRYWYSPEAKTWIKREVEKEDFWKPSKVYDSQLISYELKK